VAASAAARVIMHKDRGRTVSLSKAIFVCVGSVIVTLVLWAGARGAGKAAPLSGAAAWTFDDVTDTSAPDATGNSNTAALTDGAATSTDVPFPKIKPSSNRSLSLDGQDDCLYQSDLTDFKFDATFEMWIKPGSFGEENWLWKVSRGDDNSVGSTYYALRLVKGRVEAFFGNRTDTAVSDEELALNKWIHLAVTYDAANQRVTLFVDGSPQATTAGFRAPHFTSGLGDAVGSVYIGSEGAKNNFSGLIDEIRITEGILTDEQILNDARRSLVSEE
jgi:hypothetical protein